MITPYQTATRSKMTIALVGDYDEKVTAHRAIPLAIDLASSSTVDYRWIRSNEIKLNTLTEYSAFWCVPASPYTNMENVLAVIKHARTNNIPFLGTCGGYQHAALEFARNELGYKKADNAEVNPESDMPLISALSCKLYDVEDSISLKSGSVVQSIYGADQINEGYFCGYGVNSRYLSIFEASDLSFTGFDADGDPRVLEIRNNRFFVGTAYQPERSALSGKAHPLLERFVKSATN